MNAAIRAAISLDRQRETAKHLKRFHGYSDADVNYYAKEYRGALQTAHNYHHANEKLTHSH